VSREVITVTGPIAPEELGVTSMHEHALADGTCYAWPDASEEFGLGQLGAIRRQVETNRANLLVDDPEMVADELAEFREAGGLAIVDMSTPGLRVDVSALPSISERSGVRIVTGTGMYIDRSRPDWFANASIDELADWMVGEVEEGIDGSGVRAGQIGEIGIEKLDDGDRKLLRAAVRAADRTGVSISIHPGFEDGCDGRAIADVMEGEGVRPERVVIGHGDAFLVETKVARLVDDPDSWGLRLDYHRELLSRGYNLSIDCFGHDWRREDEDWMVENDWQRLAGLVALIREGYADQLVIGCDVFMRTLHRRGGGLGYRYLLDWVLPQLRARGFGDETIDKLTFTNPARILSREAPA
jgi:phosphotriesterase-related protein